MRQETFNNKLSFKTCSWHQPSDHYVLIEQTIEELNDNDLDNNMYMIFYILC